MSRVKITLTPKATKSELIIGIQTESSGRLVRASIPGVEKLKKTVLEGDTSNNNFRAKVERALYMYVPKPHTVILISEFLDQIGA